MSEKVGYVEREYRIYGHRCTRRRYILEFVGIAISTIAIIIFSFVTANGCDATRDFAIPLGVGSGLIWLYYKIRMLNVNGYDSEKPKEPLDTPFIPWKGS